MGDAVEKAVVVFASLNTCTHSPNDRRDIFDKRSFRLKATDSSRKMVERRQCEEERSPKLRLLDDRSGRTPDG